MTPAVKPLGFDPAALRGLSERAPCEAAKETIEGAQWRDPEKVDEWGPALAGQPVLVYCVYGHEVGQSTAARLRQFGVDARFLVGGIEQWKKAGRPVQPK